MTKLPPLPAKPTPSYPILPGVLLKCPIAECYADFTRKQSCLRHLKQKHELTADSLSDLAANLPTVKTKCKKCGQ